MSIKKTISYLVPYDIVNKLIDDCMDVIDDFNIKLFFF